MISYVDIAIVPVPSHCVSRRSFDDKIVVTTPTAHNDARDCDWTNHQGVGLRSTKNIQGNVAGDVFYCCSPDAMAENLCPPEQAGRLLVHPHLFKGATFNVTLPPPLPPLADDNAIASLSVNKPSSAAIAEEGTYVIIMANCYNEAAPSHTVVVTGNIVVQSYTSVVENFLDENVPFYLIMTLCNLGLFLWYLSLMQKYKESRIPLETWICVTIGLGFANVLVLFIQNTIWEEQFYRSGGDLDALQGTGVEEVALNFIWIIGALLGAMKHALSRYLLVVLALGWGVVHSSVHPVKRVASATLAILYFTVSAMIEVVHPFMANSAFLQELTIKCFYVKVATECIFLIWIPVALCRTMKYLTRSHQTRKLERYRALLRILGLAVLLTVGLLVLIILDYVWNEGANVTVFNITQGNELNFFLILLCVARLWKPNPLARDYVYAVQLGTAEDDDDNGNTNGYSDYPEDEGPLGMEGREGYLTDLELSVRQTARSKQETDNDNNNNHTIEPRTPLEFQNQDSVEDDDDYENDGKYGDFAIGSASE